MTVKNVILTDNTGQWLMHYSIDRLNLAIAGKALGVNLVKVVKE